MDTNLQHHAKHSAEFIVRAAGSISALSSIAQNDLLERSDGEGRPFLDERTLDGLLAAIEIIALEICGHAEGLERAASK